MHESVRLILTEQLEQVFVSITAMLATAWYISSLADAGFNMKTPPELLRVGAMASFRLAPTAQLVNFLLAEVWVGVFLLSRSSSPLLNYRAGKRPLWEEWLLVLLFMCLPPVAHILLHNLRVAIIQRESLSRGGTKAYAQAMLPASAWVLFVQFCLLTTLTTYVFSFPLVSHVAKLADAHGSGRERHIEVCESYINESYIKTHCTPRAPMFNFDLVGELQHSPASFGLARLQCNDDKWPAWAGVYRSLYHSCLALEHSSSVYQVEPLNWCSLWLLCPLIFREIIAAIDDRMSPWNWISRARNWEEVARTSRRGASWSAARIIGSILLAGCASVLAVVSAIVTLVWALLRYTVNHYRNYAIVPLIWTPAGDARRERLASLADALPALNLALALALALARALHPSPFTLTFTLRLLDRRVPTHALPISPSSTVRPRAQRRGEAEGERGEGEDRSGERQLS